MGIIAGWFSFKHTHKKGLSKFGLGLGFFFSPSYAFRGWHEELRIYKTNLDTFC